MELYPGWLEKALTVFKAQPEVAAITGKIIDVIPDAAPVEEGQAPALNADEALTDVRHMGGAAIYRRSVLEQVGTFNPYLYSDEEPELCLRIRDAGYRVVGLTYPIAYHYSPESEALSNLFARWQRKLYLGAGQNLRYHFGRKTFTRYLWERGFGIVPGFGMTAGLFCLSWSFLTHNWFWFTGWATIFVLFVTINVFRKRSLYLTVASLLKRFFILDGTIRGLFLRPLEPESYSAKFEVIQSASTLDIGNISSSPILR
jgi:GT2 family glycosyltransferase